MTEHNLVESVSLKKESDIKQDPLDVKQEHSDTNIDVKPIEYFKMDYQPETNPKTCQTYKYLSNDKTERLLTQVADTVRKKQAGSKLYRCNVCSYETRWWNLLKQHFKTHGDEKNYSCPMCDFKTNFKGSLSNHVTTHSRAKYYACDKCEYKTEYKSNIRVHVHRHTGFGFVNCEICSKSVHRYFLKSHLKLHTAEKRFACELCDYRSNNREHLRGHLKTHSTEKELSCVLCDYRTNYKSNLRNHLKTHDEVRDYTCPVCKYKTPCRDALRVHVRTHTFLCDVCGFKTNYKSSLKVHMESHGKRQIFACDLCEFKTNYKYNLKLHADTHDRTRVREKCFGCVECDFRTHYKSSLVLHAKRHSGEGFKRVRCVFCCKSLRKSSLRNHMKIHAKEIDLKETNEEVEQNFGCNDCGFRTYNKNLLKYHVKKHFKRIVTNNNCRAKVASET